MARPRKRFTKEEFKRALSYIERKLKLDDTWPGGSLGGHERAYREFRKVRLRQDPEALKDWCERWLDEKGRKKLLAALRARKKRERQGECKKTVSLDQRAWLYLSGLARRDNVTLSEFLIKRLEEEYMDMIQGKEDKV